MKTRGILLTLTFAALSHAQTSAFEVASIKPNVTGSNTTVAGTDPGGKFNATNVTLKDLIAYAYHVKDAQVSGLSGHLASDRYNIEAKANTPKEMSPEEVGPYLRQLLADRFGLKVRRESKPGKVYALVVAKGGPKLSPHPDTPGSSGISSSSGAGKGAIQASKANMTGLADHLAGKAGRPVIDKTGLTGEYDFRLEWASDQSTDPTLPSFFTALQEQLGLKLEPAEGPVETIVVETAHQASEN